MKTYRLLFFYLMFQMIPTYFANAVDSDFVHLDINEYATIKSTLDLYIQEHLGYPDGISHEFHGREAVGWIRIGGQNEDKGIRWFNHFHDPLQPYDNAGLWGIPNSSLVWAQNSEKK